MSDHLTDIEILSCDLSITYDNFVKWRKKEGPELQDTPLERVWVEDFDPRCPKGHVSTDPFCSQCGGKVKPKNHEVTLTYIGWNNYPQDESTLAEMVKDLKGSAEVVLFWGDGYVTGLRIKDGAFKEVAVKYTLEE